MASLTRESDGRLTLSFLATPEAVALALRLLPDQAASLAGDGPTTLAPMRQLRLVTPAVEPEQGP